MVKKIQNRCGVEIWPWERAGFALTLAEFETLPP
jgi:hypothetical protein